MTDRHSRAPRWRHPAFIASLLALTACSTTVPVVRDVDGLPCMTFRKTHRPTRICATQPAPGAEVARDVMAMAPGPAGVHLLVLWRERAGATRPLVLGVDGRDVAELVPGGLVRLQLEPGAHQLSVAWGQGHAVMAVQARAGSLQIAEVVGRLKFMGIQFDWELPESPAGQQRAAAARVIADLDLRGDPLRLGGSVAPAP